jgi:hypothetical protein
MGDGITEAMPSPKNSSKSIAFVMLVCDAALSCLLDLLLPLAGDDGREET